MLRWQVRGIGGLGVTGFAQLIPRKVPLRICNMQADKRVPAAAMNSTIVHCFYNLLNIGTYMILFPFILSPMTYFIIVTT